MGGMAVVLALACLLGAGALFVGARALLALEPVEVLGQWRARVLPLGERYVPERYRRWLVRQWSEAGAPAAWHPERVLLAQGGLAVLGLLAGAVMGRAPLLAIAGAAAGAAWPVLRLRERVRARGDALVRTLPAVLDLLALSVEAGLDFGSSLSRVVAGTRAGPLRDDLARVVGALRLGRTREEALGEWAARVGRPEVVTLVTALVQASRMGTGLGRVLRHHAQRLRQERTQRAERRAAEAPVKLLFPLVAFLLPAVFLVLFGPLAFAFLGGGGE